MPKEQRPDSPQNQQRKQCTNKINLLGTPIYVLLSYHQINFLLQHTAKTYNRTLYEERRDRVLGTHISRWNFSIKSLHSKLRETHRRGCRRRVRARERIKRTKPSETRKQTTYELTEAEAASMGLRGSASGHIFTYEQILLCTISLIRTNYIKITRDL